MQGVISTKGQKYEERTGASPTQKKLRELRVVSLEKREAGSCQWCSVTGQDKRDTN